MPLPTREYLQHILAETIFLQNETQDVSRLDFLADPVLTRACIRSLEIIGEAVKQLPDTVRSQASHIEWQLIARMRDHLIHRYFGVDYDIVWDVITTKIPELNIATQMLLAKELRPPDS